MIDPDGIITSVEKEVKEIKLTQVQDCDFEPYDFDDEKSFKTYMSDIEKEVRGSFEYRQAIAYMRNFMGMNQCAYIAKANNIESFDIKIELHHYPFSLYDICSIVYDKRCFFKEPLDLEMVAKEVEILHYKCMVGLIPLSETLHKLYHNGRLFIPIDVVFGRYDLFMTYYDKWISPEQKDIIARIEKYTAEQVSELLNTTIIDTHNLPIFTNQKEFQLPPVSTVGQAMIDQIDKIKDNSYKLPTVHDRVGIEDKKEDRRGIQSPIYYIR